VRILIVEDDTVIASLIRKGLERERFDAEVAADGEIGLQLAQNGGYGAIILDVMLPRKDGWAVCAALRARRDTTPILMLTARDSVDDRVRGLETGADDYLPKPFDFKELLARVRALLRRDRLHKARVFRIADLEIDSSAGRVSRAGQEILLTPREFTLLEALASNEGRVLTREAIQERVFLDDEAFSNTVTVHVANLRKKIDAAHEVKLIHTVHGFGYTLRSPETEVNG
jgi:two-component system copper resistance phosphate regulon response regulator CusR